MDSHQQCCENTFEKHREACFGGKNYQHYWWESFDGDSFVSQSRFDAYATCTSMQKNDVYKTTEAQSSSRHKNFFNISNNTAFRCSFASTIQNINSF